MAVDVLEELSSHTFRDILEADPRPTLIVDLKADDPSVPSCAILNPVFCNSALRNKTNLLEDITERQSAASSSDRDVPADDEFRKWATTTVDVNEGSDHNQSPFHYRLHLWTYSTIGSRWRIISGVSLSNSAAKGADPRHSVTSTEAVDSKTSENDAQPGLSSKRDDPTARPVRPVADVTRLTSTEHQQSLKPFNYVKALYDTTDGNSGKNSKSLNLAASTKSVTDWTVAEPRGILTEHMTFARSIDWAATPLGPMHSWTPEFRQVANLVMGNPHPAALFWGSELTVFYNYAYAVEIAGNKHPSLMGTGFVGPFQELWDSVAPVFAECARTGVSVRRDNDYLTMERHGLKEETFFSWSMTPLYGGGEQILGFYNAPYETTKTTVSDRRLQTINRLGERLSESQSVNQLWRGLISGLETNHFDVPFALVYSIGDGEIPDGSSISSESTLASKSCLLEGSIGVPDGHSSAPKHLELDSHVGFAPVFRQAMHTREPVKLSVQSDVLPEALLDGFNYRGFGDPCREVIIFPVRPTTSDNMVAFLVIGVNPRRPYDDEYKTFVKTLNRQLATSLASVMLFEEEARRNRLAIEAATLQQQHLTQALALQTSRMRRMTESSPLGMYLLNPEGMIDEANDRFLEMTGMTRETLTEFSWLNIIKGAHTDDMHERWRKLIEDKEAWSGELELRKSIIKPRHLEGEEIDYWVLASSVPEYGPDGTLISVMGSITDISHLKWAQGLQTRRLEEAEETRRQQNEFIDITSHEMRNPLSAILQCADDIASGLEEYRQENSTPSQAVLAECVEAAHTISLCVQHQKAIVDDILTISKLDSNLLLLTPTPTQPLAVVRRAVKMFESELQAKDITIELLDGPSFEALHLDWAILDPSRVLQILINLMTNAIKFTAASEKRVITVAVAASTEPPLQSATIPGFEYIPTRASINANRSGEEWGQGAEVYLRFKISDTGCGLTAEEKQTLFERFKQASPRTHAQYGGSGLGLFISRQLAELHGGRIGVASEAGIGSTFGFFIAVKRADPPSEVTSPGELSIVTERAAADLLFQQLPSAKGDNPKLATAKVDTMPKQASTRLAKLRISSKFDPSHLSILVVEDNLINQKVLVKQLIKVGCTVHAANDGLEALAFLDKTRYRRDEGQELSVILMDLEMPNMDGLTCVRVIRKMQSEGKIKGHVPVLAVTANVRDEQVAAARASGMDDVVSKPFRLPDLFKKLESVLNV